MKRCAALAAALAAASAAPAEHEVTSLPGFSGALPFKVYSGMLDVAGAGGYDALKIHYQFHTSQRAPATDPVVTWQQGGPGGSSIAVGLFTEMGYFQVDGTSFANSSSAPKVYANENAWNQQASMLYFEHPAGVRFSYCMQGGQPAPKCHWNDTTQAEAYYNTLVAFYKVFPELKQNDLYFTGESYSGQYLPNIAYYIDQHHRGELPLKGFMVGNGCWGEGCNGPNQDKNDVDLFYGKGLVAKKLRDAIYQACGYNGGATNADSCRKLTEQMDAEVGPHNVYDIYDNCPQQEQLLRGTGRTQSWLRREMRRSMPKAIDLGLAAAAAPAGGYDWRCGGEGAADKYLDLPEVRKALHIGKAGTSDFSYGPNFEPQSVTLYPTLLQRYRVLIYNGDADSCVPYNGNEEWTTGMVTKGVVTEKQAWHPWYASESVPAGYATTYTVKGASTDFAFVTIRLAGHMVPTFRPKASLQMLNTFLQKGSW
eukprot:TRINITY_DN1099_c0_g1_i13.p1 TRINITY_DN1099_c0_g1~~TRINITY_DN1099_c0_g1_i13.p1  ORF type:complete len:504 (+),score=212.19 TRINITY_DN1099_c0_g1_i13:72-1514(+)